MANCQRRRITPDSPTVDGTEALHTTKLMKRQLSLSDVVHGEGVWWLAVGVVISTANRPWVRGLASFALAREYLPYLAYLPVHHEIGNRPTSQGRSEDVIEAQSWPWASGPSSYRTC